MGLIRSSVFVIVCFLFFLSLIAGSLFLTFGMSLDYEVVQPSLMETVAGLAVQINLDEKVDDAIPVMQMYCLNNSEYVFNENGYTFEIPCGVVAEGSAENIMTSAFDSFADGIYYKNYDCSLQECVSEGQFTFLVSKQAQDYWYSKFSLVMVLIVLLLAGMFFLAESKSNFLIVAGVLTAVASLLAFKMDSLLNLVIEMIFSNAYNLELIDDSMISGMTGMFFAKSFDVFVFMFIAGVVLFVLGIAFKFFNFGMKISEFFSKIKSKKTNSGKSAGVKSKSVKPVKKSSG